MSKKRSKLSYKETVFCNNLKGSQSIFIKGRYG